VPLILRYPPDFPAGTRSEAQASLIDVAPTLLRAAGLEPPEAFVGRPLQEHESFGERYVLVQYPFYQEKALQGRRRKQSAVRSVAGDPLRPSLGDEEKVGVVGEGWKYLRSGESEELYRLLPEPEEGRSLAEAEPEVRQGLAERLDALLEAHPLNLVDPPAINDELRETLRALGYLDS
jgi:arylsulfatase A-like enzyme